MSCRLLLSNSSRKRRTDITCYNTVDGYFPNHIRGHNELFCSIASAAAGYDCMLGIKRLKIVGTVGGLGFSADWRPLCSFLTSASAFSYAERDSVLSAAGNLPAEPPFDHEL